MTQEVDEARMRVENAIASLFRQDIVGNFAGSFPDGGYGRMLHAQPVEIEFDPATVIEAASLVLSPERVTQLAGAFEAYAKANDDLRAAREAGLLSDNFAYFDKEMNFPDRDEHPDMPAFRQYQGALDQIERANAALNEVRAALKG